MVHKMRFLVFILTLVRVINSKKVKGIECGAVGVHNITISWQATYRSNSITYSVYFCKHSCRNPSGNKSQFFHGCTLNSTKSNLYSCNIAKSLHLDFPSESKFLYYIKTRNGEAVHESKTKVCPVHWYMKCTDPRGLTIAPSGDRSLQLRWQPPTDMGTIYHTCGYLCYKIVYGINGSSEKERVSKHTEDCAFTMKGLQPYTAYSVFLSCSIDCDDSSKWSNQVGPVVATTLEEIPQGKVIFEKIDIVNSNSNSWSKNITVYFRLPAEDHWNGNIIYVTAYNCSKKYNKCGNITVPPTLNRIFFNFLRRDEDYLLQAEYCNTKGCSQKSNNLTIQSNPPQTLGNTTNKKENSNNRNILIGVTVVVVVILILVFVCILCKQRFQNQTKRRPLDFDIGEIRPTAPDDSNDEAGEQANEYVDAVLIHDVPSQSTMNGNTTDFQSASHRSLHSFSMDDIN